MRKYKYRYILMTIGVILYSMGVGLFLDPNGLAPGGVTGIAVILHHVFNIPTGFTIIFLNIPILYVGWKKFGKRFIASTVYCTFLSSLLVDLWGSMKAATGDLFLSAISGGTLIAVGLGMILRMGSSTGGMDILIKLLRIRKPHIKTGSLLLFLDAVIVGISGIVFRNLDLALYAATSVFVTSNVLDTVLYGRDEAKLICIISDKAQEIANRFLRELSVGATFMQGYGAYSNKEKKVILCAMRKHLAPKAEVIVKEVDMSAFMIIGRASEIYGEGYKSYLGEKI